MKILLILAGDVYYRASGEIFQRHRVTLLEPTSLSTLAALVPEELKAVVDIIDEGVSRPRYAHKLYDVVGIYFCTSAADRAYALCRYWRLKGAFVVAGGPHASLMPDEAARYADAVVCGPAEIHWPQLLRDFHSGKHQRVYAQEPAEWWPVPAPGGLRNRRHYTPIPSMAASRGCINRCTYCILPVTCQGALFKRPLNQVEAEIKSLKSKYVLLLDPSPLSDKTYAAALFQLFMDLKVGWACQATIEAAFDSGLLDLMAKAGCAAVFTGFESFNNRSLQQYNKRFPDAALYKEAIANFHEKGISVVGGFIMGSDSEDKQSLMELPDLIYESKADLARLAVLTPYPGTKLYGELHNQGRILHKKWYLYDEDHVVFKPHLVTETELQKLYHRAWNKLYTYPRIFHNLAKNKTMPKWLYFTILYGFRAFGKKLVRIYDKKYDPEAGLSKV